MMSLLTRTHDEAKRLLVTYTLYKDSEDYHLRRKVHLDLDRFLMENRETAIICIERVLQEEIDNSVAEARKANKAKMIRFKRIAQLSDADEATAPWYKRLAYKLQRRQTDGGVLDGSPAPADAITRDA